MFLRNFSSTKSPWTKWCVFFLWMLLCQNLMARADTDMWVPRTVLVGFLKLNHPYNHGVSLLDHKVCCSVTKSCSTLFTLMDCSIPGFPVLHYLPRLLRLMSIESVMPSNRLILCRPLLLLPSIFPSIRVFSNESALRIRCGQSTGAYNRELKPCELSPNMRGQREKNSAWKQKDPSETAKIKYLWAKEEKFVKENNKIG